MPSPVRVTRNVTQEAAGSEVVTHHLERARNGVTRVQNLAHLLPFFAGEVTPDFILAVLLASDFPLAAIFPGLVLSWNRLVCRPEYALLYLGLAAAGFKAFKLFSALTDMLEAVKDVELLTHQRLAEPVRDHLGQCGLAGLHGHTAALELVADDTLARLAHDLIGNAGKQGVIRFVFLVNAVQVCAFVFLISRFIQQPQDHGFLPQVIDSLTDRFSKLRPIAFSNIAFSQDTLQNTRFGRIDALAFQRLENTQAFLHQLVLVCFAGTVTLDVLVSQLVAVNQSGARVFNERIHPAHNAVILDLRIRQEVFDPVIGLFGDSLIAIDAEDFLHGCIQRVIHGLEDCIDGPAFLDALQDLALWCGFLGGVTTT